MRLLAIFISSLFCVPLFGQEKRQHEFSLLRQNDKIDSVTRSNYSWYDQLKYSKLGNDGFLTFGGSFRAQYELFNNEEFSFSPNVENGWYLQRILFHSDIHLSENVRVFGELGSSIISGKELLTPVDRDELYVNQFFIEFNLDRVSFKVGRENLGLGSNRLLDPREGPNVRQSFDNISARWKSGQKEYTAFAGSLVKSTPGVFDNEMFQDEEYLWGFYNSRLIATRMNIDAYYLGFHRQTSIYDLGTEEEYRHSFGLRQWKDNGRWKYDNETIVQVGSFGDKNIFAWTVSFNISNQINESNRLGIKTELISGTTSEETLGTFNPLYPRGAYFGRVARFGPANLIDIHPYWNFRTGRFWMEIDYDVFWRFSTRDAVYGPPMNIVLDGESSERFIAQQVGTIFNYEFSSFAVIELETNLIFPGSYIEEVRPGAKTLFHSVFTMELRF